MAGASRTPVGAWRSFGVTAASAHRATKSRSPHLLCSTVHRIGARPEVRVTNQLIKEFKRVTGKENLLFRLAAATVDAGDKLVRDAVYPVASRTVLADLVTEFKSSGPTYQRTVKATLKASYTNHYRAGDDDQAALGAGVPQILRRWDLSRRGVQTNRQTSTRRRASPKLT